ncbi:Nuclear control of ATPase [Micractinium conductrix]|uniref:Nuclear control of ATPase n=1 Tax=Micractinium conductrix TaxID=554055 RepID=A0A2P6VET3_9CHLO|nr:Nuclear control of ATPase [Micractinium conductrix]|eukprot:PSC72602.1 Nuclear control of ATPase [Micractinium conductrix]
MDFVKALAGLPFRLCAPLVRGPVGVVLLVAGVQRRRSFQLPVASLDEARAQPIWFTLKRAASNAQEQAIADLWLESLSMCQVGFGLLLRELDEVEANLRFWHGREQRGGHFWHTLLRRGPAEFAGRLAALLHLRRPAAGALAEAGKRCVAGPGYLVEKRVLIFRLLRSALCEALAQVQAAAALLYLQAPPPRAAAAGGGARAQGGDAALGHAASAGEIAGAAAAAAAAGGEEEEGLFQRTDRLVGASMAAVAAAFRQLDQSVHATLDAQQGPAAPPAADWQVLQAGLSRVLGLHHLRRVFSRLQLQQAGAAAAGAAGEAAAAGGGAEAPPPVLLLPPPPPPPLVPVSTAAALGAARRSVGYTTLLPANATVHSTLQAARRCTRAQRGRRLIEVPYWARMPSELQQHWIRYAALGLATGWGTIFLYRHSRLSGSQDLDRWLRAGAAAVRGAYAEHVVAPLASVKDELFNTFRRRSTIVGMSDYEAETDSLRRMLEDFQRDFVRRRRVTAAALPDGGGGGSAGPPYGTPSNASEAGADQEMLSGMDMVMRTYEREMQKPLRNLVGGELVRALLIQVQKLKVDTTSAMLELDQILKANELSISLIAAVPSFLIGGFTLYYLGGLVTPSPPDPRREALPVRMAFVEVERALENVAAAEEATAAAAAAGAEPGAEAVVESREQQGLLAFRLAVAFEEARELFRRHRGLIAIAGSEWPNIRSDLLELAGPSAVGSKMRTAQRMGRTYAIFQHCAVVPLPLHLISEGDLSLRLGLPAGGARGGGGSGGTPCGPASFSLHGLESSHMALQAAACAQAGAAGSMAAFGNGAAAALAAGPYFLVKSRCSSAAVLTLQALGGSTRSSSGSEAPVAEHLRLHRKLLQQDQEQGNSTGVGAPVAASGTGGSSTGAPGPLPPPAGLPASAPALAPPSNLACCCRNTVGVLPYQPDFYSSCCCGETSTCCGGNSLLSKMCASKSTCSVILVVLGVVGLFMAATCIMSGICVTRRRRRQLAEVHEAVAARQTTRSAEVAEARAIQDLPPDKHEELAVRGAAPGDEGFGATLDCAVCLETVDVTADAWRAFPCRHGACSGCVADIVRFNRRRGAPGLDLQRVVHCPLCRKLAIRLVAALRRTRPNVDVFAGPPQPIAYPRHMPVHRHDCEEVFLIQRGVGTLRYRAPDGSLADLRFARNDTLLIPPNMMHQFVNTHDSEDLQAVVVFDSPPVDITTFANWGVPARQGRRQRPYFWDRSCPPTLPSALQRLAAGGGGTAGGGAAAGRAAAPADELR